MPNAPYDGLPLTRTAESLPPLPEVSDVLEVGILTVDADLIVRGWNRWFTVASGLDAATVLGQPLFALFRELAGGPTEHAFRRALGGATTVWSHQFHRYLLPLPSPPGHDGFAWMQQSARIMPLLRDGQIEGVVALVQDVTERVAREEELRSALERAEVASQTKSDFLASMSHELRTPLTAIVGYMDLLEGEMVGPVAPLQKTYLRRVRTAGHHLMSIIEEILTFSRVEAGKESVHVQTFDASALARDVEDLFEPQALHKRLTLDLAVPADGATMSTDATKLRQILINIVGNAIKFTDAGTVSLHLMPAEHEIRFVVRDTGPGIRAEDLQRIFDPFTQLDQTLKRGKGGTGLGLPVSRRLAELLGGELHVDSTPGEGTTFTLLLPRVLGVIDEALTVQR